MNRFEILKLSEDSIPCYALQLPPKTPEEEKQAILANYLSTHEGRLRLAASLAAPFRTRLEYNSGARQVFRVEPLPEGALPTFTNCTMYHE